MQEYRLIPIVMVIAIYLMLLHFVDLELISIVDYVIHYIMT